MTLLSAYWHAALKREKLQLYEYDLLQEMKSFIMFVKVSRVFKEIAKTNSFPRKRRHLF